jgi:hypothetical protein
MVNMDHHYITALKFRDDGEHVVGLIASSILSITHLTIFDSKSGNLIRVL